MSNVLSFHLCFTRFRFFPLTLCRNRTEKMEKKIDMFEVYFFFLGVMKTRTPHICQLLISLQIHHQQLFSIPYKSPISALLMHCRWIIDVFFFVHVLYSRHCIYLNNRACLHIVVWRTSTRSLFLFEFSSSCDEYTFFFKFFLKINDGNATTHVLLNGYKKS